MIDVIICTRNPRETVFSTVLNSLAHQSLSRDLWTLTIVDSQSTSPLTASDYQSYHPAVRVIRAPQTGLSAARHTGIRSGTSDLIVFVDDDNELGENYLENATRIAREWPKLGAWGGWCEGVYETEPEPWLRDYLRLLCVFRVDRERWSNQPDALAMPAGAGMCIRRPLAEVWCEMYERDRRLWLLDRNTELTHRGAPVLLSGGDSHIALTVLRSGFGCGKFPQLHIRHHIPKDRLDVNYLSRLAFGMRVSESLIKSIHGEPRDRTTLQHVFRRWLKVIRKDPQSRKIEMASILGAYRSESLVKQLCLAAKRHD